MTAKEYRNRLAEMSDVEFADFKKKWGGDSATREEYVQWFLQHPTYEARLCDLLGMPTEDEKRTAHPAIVQHIGNAQVVAGHSIHGGVTVVNLTFVEVLQAVERQIQQDPKLPEQEKRSLLAKLNDIASNPYIVNLATSAIWDGAKLLWTLAQRV